ncbi:hypothetical protein QX240_20595 [Vibrio vulnificus]|nr:hypothetical protein [Vibrio vulnificus]
MVNVVCGKLVYAALTP